MGEAWRARQKEADQRDPVKKAMREQADREKRYEKEQRKKDRKSK